MAVWPLCSNIIRRNKNSNTFGMVRRYSNGRPKPHQGWDFSASLGTPTFAISKSKVVFVRDTSTYGRQVCISFKEGEKNLFAFYAHLASVVVSKGQELEEFDLIGTTGESGNALGMATIEQHLHFEIRTKAWCGLGLEGRISPYKIYGTCPLHSLVYQFPPVVIRPR